MTMPWVLRRTGREALRHKASVVALVGAFAALAALGAVAAFGARAADALAPFIEHDVHVIAYLQDKVSSDRIDAISGILTRLPGVKSVASIDSGEAARRLRAEAAALRGGSALVDGFEDGFLPRTLEIALEPSDNLTARAIDLADRLRKIAGIAEVDAMENGLFRLVAWLNLARRAGQVIFALALMAGLAALAWSVGKARDRRREQADTLSLLGESPSGIRLPSGIIGVTAAFVGTVVGVGTASIVFGSIFESVLRAFGGASFAAGSSIGPVKLVPSLGSAELALLFSLAAVTGWFSGRLATPLPRVRDA
jgi:cell division protein FtsX